MFVVGGDDDVGCRFWLMVLLLDDDDDDTVVVGAILLVRKLPNTLGIMVDLVFLLLLLPPVSIAVTWPLFAFRLLRILVVVLAATVVLPIYFARPFGCRVPVALLKRGWSIAVGMIRKSE